MQGRGSPGAFVGRAPELAALIEAFDRAGTGRAATALVGGEAGVGKSRLVRELAAHARRAQARVLVGHCLDLEEGGLPYAPFVDIARTLARELPDDEGGATVRPLRAALGSAPEELPDVAEAAGTASPDPFGRARAFELLLTLLERLTAGGRVVVLVVEDVHWADRSTGDLVTLLSTSAGHLPLLLVVTYRTDEGDRRRGVHALAADLTRRGATHLRLARLDRAEVVELTGALLGAPPGAELAATIVDRTDGNPLFVEELVAAVAGDPAAPMPPHLRDAVLSRVARMPPEAAAVLRSCAVAGRQVEHDLLAAALATADGGAAAETGVGVGVGGGIEVVDDRGLAVALRACVDHQLLVVDRARGGYRFRHALVHEAVLDEILPGELAELHRAYARALAAAGGTGGDRWARLAHHWSAAGDYDAALGAAVRAGLAAERAFAIPEAHRYLEWSVRLWDRAADPVAAAGCDRGELLARAADAANRAGATVRALTLVDEALATGPVAADPVRSGLLHERRGWYLERAGREADALGAYDRAVALVPAEPPSSARAHVLQAHGHGLERAGQHAAARRRAEEALAVARATGDRADEGQARHVLGLVLAAEGRRDEAIAELYEAGQIAVGLGDLAEVAGAYVHLWRTLVEAGRAADLVDLVAAFLPGTGPLNPPPTGPPTAPATQPPSASATGPATEPAGASATGPATEPAGGTPAAAASPPVAGPGGGVTGGADAGGSAPPSLTGTIAAAALHQLGRWDEADRLLGGGAPGGGEGRETDGLTAAARILVAGALAVDRGVHDRARQQLETARAWCHQVGDGRLNGLLHRSLAELAVWQERFDDARQEVATGLELLAHTGDPELEARLAAVGIRAEADRVAARARAATTRPPGPAEPTAVAAGLMAQLDRLAARAEARQASPTCETFAARLTGHAELSRLTGHSDVGRWRKAAAAWDGIGFPYAAAYARFRGAEAGLAAVRIGRGERGRGRPDRARNGGRNGDRGRDRAVAELRDAHAAATRLGARPLATAIERLARRARVDLAGVEGPGTEPVPASAAGAAEPSAPTRREAEVLALVAQGLTNRQIGEALFISEKTASVHVSRLLAKLGASTRGEAAAVARRRGLLSD